MSRLSHNDYVDIMKFYKIDIKGWKKKEVKEE
jgi:hypothetical protein